LHILGNLVNWTTKFWENVWREMDSVLKSVLQGTLDHYVPQSSRPYWYYLEPLVGFSTSKPCVCCAYFYWKMSTSADHSTRSAHD
ncbi:hypothetical protein T11_16024, partial [Trichinella zimbabwensis]